MNKKIWNQLGTFKFYIEYLSLYVARTRKIQRNVDLSLIFFSILSIAGWNQWAEYYVVWTILLASVQAIRLLKDRLFVSEGMLYTLISTQYDYNVLFTKCSKLWYDFRRGNLSEQQAMKKYEAMLKEELNIIKDKTKEKIPEVLNIKNKATKATDDYMNNLKTS